MAQPQTYEGELKNSKVRDVSASNDTPLKDELEHIGKIGQKMAADSLKMAVDSFEDVKKNIKNYYTIGENVLSDMEKKVESGVNKYPFRALMIAAGVGFLVGLIRKKG